MAQPNPPRPMGFDEAIKTLRLEMGASKKEIREAFRKLVVENHPDKFTDEVEKEIAAKNFRKIKEAYNFLMSMEPVKLRGSRGEPAPDPLANIYFGSAESSFWSGKSSTQGQIFKFILILFPLCILFFIGLLYSGKILKWFSSLF